MTVATSIRPASATGSAPTVWQLNPFLHFGPGQVYDPLTDRLIGARELNLSLVAELVAGQRELDGLSDGETQALAEQGVLLPGDVDPASRFRLKYASLEALTACNQSCYFCPVSVAPREDYSMPTELYERIVGELAAYRETLEAVFMISYNEPTLDKRFVEQVRTLKAAGLPPATLTNGTGLTPARVDALVEMGGLRFLSVNLSTLDREKYRRDRGGDHLPVVLRNLQYVKDKPVAEQMDMVVLGTGDEQHKSDFQAIQELFARSRFNVKYFEVNDRAGYLQIGLRVDESRKRLAGCDLVGSRPLQHVHVNPRAQCILCCQDYRESEVVGDLTHQSLAEVLTGAAMRQARRWVYGLDEAPADYICRTCKFALTR